ncbi:MAG TPA: K(+)-transporting ATPase subunit C [Acidimicrobiales bacterium]
MLMLVRRQIVPAVLVVLVFTVLLGLVYPLVVTGVSQLAFHDKANGSLVESDGQAVGSELIGQAFTGPSYFWPRPSAAGDGYDATASGSSNLGPNDETLLGEVDQRAVDYRQANGLAPDVEVPVDAVTASASGLDPHISVANARLQAGRVARERGVPVEQVLDQIEQATEGPALGVLGAKGVNVLRLNLALDDAD